MQPRSLFHRRARRWNLFQRAALATLAAMALTACEAEFPFDALFTSNATHPRSIP